MCISTSFQVLRTPESWSKPFFQPFFNLICSFQSFFSDFTAEIKKHLKMNKKTWFYLLLKAGRHAKAGRLPGGYPEIVFFRLIIWTSYSNTSIHRNSRVSINMKPFKLPVEKNKKLFHRFRNWLQTCLVTNGEFFCSSNFVRNTVVYEQKVL